MLRKKSVVNLHMFYSIRANSRKNKLKNENIFGKVGVTSRRYGKNAYDDLVMCYVHLFGN